jgi:hypothetical protein
VRGVKCCVFVAGRTGVWTFGCQRSREMTRRLTEIARFSV